jgi:CRP-like cAMP-binding protein
MDVTHLDGLPLFAGLSKKQLQLIAQHADEIDLAEGKELIHEGALSWQFFVIKEGEAEVRHITKTIRTLGPGDFFGEIGVMTPDARRTASVITTSPMKAIVMSSHDLRALATEMPDLAERLRITITDRMQQFS